MKKMLIALGIILLLVSCARSRSIPEEILSPGKMHNAALTELATKVLNDPASTDSSSVVSDLLSLLEEAISRHGNGKRDQVIELSDSARSLYHRLNAILIHQSQEVESVDTLLNRIVQWQTDVSSDTYISNDEIDYLLATGDVAYNSLIYWTDSENIRPIDKIRHFFQENPTRSREIRGTVYDEYGERIIGATVVVSNSNIGTLTNYDGEFIISV